MSDFADYSAFIAIVEQGSLTAAAKHLDRSLQAISRALMALEQDLGITLIQRTTRRSRPTEAGLAFLARVRPALAELALARSEASAQAGRISGRIRIAGPALFGPSNLVPLIADFMSHHPAVEIELELGEAYADIVGSGFDLAVRIGSLPDSGLTARRLGVLPQVVFGAPSYFAKNGWPLAPADLERHACIIRFSSQTATTWAFHRGDRTHAVKVRGPFRSDNPAACNAAALHGLGIAQAPLFQVRDWIKAGRLAVVLRDYTLDPMPIHLVRPPGRTAAPVRLLIDHLVGKLDLGRIQDASPVT